MTHELGLLVSTSYTCRSFYFNPPDFLVLYVFQKKIPSLTRAYYKAPPLALSSNQQRRPFSCPWRGYGNKGWEVVICSPQ